MRSRGIDNGVVIAGACFGAVMTLLGIALISFPAALIVSGVLISGTCVLALLGA